MNKYDIRITRYQSILHTVYADSLDEAKERAEDYAYDFDWQGIDHSFTAEVEL